MNIAGWWTQLSGETRDWLVEHNGEPLTPSVRSEVVAVNDGDLDPSWWSGESVDGQSELTDEAIDWIEARANDEVPGP
ncbi:hypothetical protein [Rhodococcus sp. W8901]|uniref:hypothetical protein n=1 Tax=Rhodococcus sp. W8901 TaxID=2742603 RepID=UPI0015830367|nr:hypothetical protein [Rhodococcus sp. W8901]QKT11627.1 hypothetical protein HUN07_13565 [Rhodococcus sp. W8901]